MNRTFHDREQLTPDEAAVFHEAHCPDCGGGLLMGPCGGLSINIYCANETTCGSKFNEMGPFGIERISEASPNKPKGDSTTPYRG
jgi:hypothetical protein